MRTRYKRVRRKAKIGKKFRSKYSVRKSTTKRRYAPKTKISTAMRIAVNRAINPPLKYEIMYKHAFTLTEADSADYSLLFDPTFTIASKLLSTMVRVGPFGGNAAIRALINQTTGETDPTGLWGQSWWILDPMIKIRLTNYTSAKVFYKIYVVQSKCYTNNTIDAVNDDNVETRAALYPQTDINFGGGNRTYGILTGSTDTAGGVQRITYKLNKITDLNECKTWKNQWKILQVHRFSLNPNENHSFKYKGKSFPYDPVRYRIADSVTAYRPGSIHFLIRCDPTITGATNELQPMADVDWMSYGNVNVPFEVYTSCRVARKTTTQERRYQYNDLTNAASDTSVIGNAAIIGQPVQQGGAAQAFVPI